MNRGGLLLLMVAVLQLSGLRAQDQFFRKYDSRQGLPSSEVYQSVQDDDGYLWFSTDHGLVRYDGYQFRTFDVDDGLPENAVFTLFKDKKNRVWFVTLSGKMGYHHKGRIYAYKHNDKLTSYFENNLSSRYSIFTKFTVDTADNIWFSMRKEGLFHIDPLGNIVHQNPQKDRHTLIIAPSSDGRMLIDHARLLPTKTIIHQRDTAVADTLDVSMLFGQRKYPNQFNDVLKLDDDIYVSENNVILHLRSGELVKAVQLQHIINRIDSDREGKIWLSTTGGGGRMFDRELNEIDVFLDGEPISSFFEDHEGGLWFTSMNSGIFYIPEKRNRVIVPSSMFRQEKIINLKTDCFGRLWFSSFNVFGYYDGKRSKRYHIGSSGETIISRILPSPDGKTLWVGTNKGIVVHDINSGRSQLLETQTQRQYSILGVKSLLYDTVQRILWVGTFAGFYGLREDGSLTPIYGDKILNRVEAIESATGGTLFLGSQIGLYTFNGQSLEPVQSTGLGNLRITALKWRNDSLWIGTRERGLMLLTSDTLMSFGRKEGLLSSSVNFIELMGKYIVAGTNKGVSVLSRDVNSGKIAIIQNITSGYGMLANEVSAMTIIGDRIVASSAGFISYLEVNPGLLMGIRMPCHITSITTSNQQIDNPEAEFIELRHNQSSISINYFAISFFIQGRHTYRHRLLGLEKDWVVNQQTTASYPYLPPGSYSFEVQVLNPDGSWSPAPESLQIVVQRPFWMTWWFIALALILGILLLLLLFYLVNKQLTRQRNIVNDMRRYQQEALALQMNPHFLFNALNTVQRYILENDRMASSRYLTRFAGFMRAMLENAQKPDTSLTEEIQLISQYLELESARNPQKFSFEIQTDKQINPDATHIPVFLIQPLVENALLHGLKDLVGDGRILVSIFAEGNDLVIRVEDNGIGREAASKTRTPNKSSLGLSIIQKRISLINISRSSKISLEIIDLYAPNGEAAGTLAVLRFPGFANLNQHEK
ncbi:MAG TPA: two-component regulator propeller domain-containing protein [Bacteroidales bacterium]|nr:two-component regulator propeller domain-containing protein [Bacteroidales bacterium]